MLSIKIKYYITTILIITFASSSISYSQKLSFKSTNSKEKKKVDELNVISKEFNDVGDIKAAIKYINESIESALSNDYEIGLANAYNIRGLIQRQQGNYEEAIKSHTLSLNIYEKHKDKEGVSLSNIYLGSCLYLLGNLNEALAKFSSAIKIANEENLIKIKAIAHNNIANIFMLFGNYSNALENYYTGLNLSEKLRDTLSIIKYNLNIGNVYWEQNNLNEALIKYKRSLFFAQKARNWPSAISAYNNMGSIYLKQRKVDDAMINYNASLKIARQIEDKRGISIALESIGQAYASVGLFSEALKNTYESLKIREIISDKLGISKIYLMLAQIYIDLKDINKAEYYLKMAFELSDEMGSKDNLIKTYKLRSIIDSSKGNFREAFNNYRIYSNLKDSLLNEKTQKQMSQLMIQFETEKKDKEIAILSIENKMKAITIDNHRIFNKFILLISFIVISLFSFFIYSQKQKQRILKLEKQKADSELDSAEKILNSYMSSIKEKNKLIGRFKAEIQSLKQWKSDEIETEKKHMIETLINSTILTEDDWIKFRRLFDEVHKGFFIRLNKKFPELTTSEKRLLTLIKLDLTYEEIASMLGISIDSAKQTSLRLRKKLNMAGQVDLFELVETI